MSDRYHIIARSDVGKLAWNTFVDTSDEAWLWHLYDLPDTVATWHGSKDCSFALLDRLTNNQIVALLPLRQINRKAIGLFPVYILESLAGPAIRNSASPKEKRNIEKAIGNYLSVLAKKVTCLEIRLFTSPMAPVFRGERCPLVNPLLDFGCENTLTQTWVVDLRSGKDTVWSRLDGRARTAIRKAEKDGVITRQATTNDLEIYYRLHVETYQRTGVTPHPYSYFKNIWDKFLSHNLAQIWIAELDGTPIAAENFAVYKNAAVYWTGASTQKGLAVEANSILQWAAMQSMIEAGIEFYETGEAFPQAKDGKRKGLNDFKKSFGGKMYPFYRGKIVGKSWVKKVYDIKQTLRD